MLTEDLKKIWEIIYGNPFVFAAFVAVVLPFAVILVGYAINLFGEAFATLVSFFVDPWLVYVIVNYLFFPGVMLHELAHALFAVLTGAKVTELALFKREGETLGHVNASMRGNMFMVSIQRIFISSAPMFVGTGVVLLCRYLILTLTIPLWGKILIGYIGVAMFFHMTMSVEDIKIYVKGIPIFMGIVFVVSLIVKLFVLK